MSLNEDPKLKQIQLGETLFTLSPLNLNVLEDIECEFGSTGAMVTALQDKPISTLKKILWILIRDNHPDMTPDSIGRMVEYQDIERLNEAIAEVLK